MRLLNIFNKKKAVPLPRKTLDDVKRVCKVLFIDDNKFKMTDKLKKEDGWQNITHIRDVDSISQPELKDAHIVFVDIQGVGKKLEFKDEGLGLIVAIRAQYPRKKIIMYSAESKEKIDAFHKAADLVDARLRKMSDRYEYVSTLERLAMEAFCLENCIFNIKRELYNNYAISMNDRDIEINLMKLNTNETISINEIQKVFNIQNAAAICEIIQFFFDINKI